MTDGDNIIAPMPISCDAVFEIGGGSVRIRQNAEKARDGIIEYRIVENTADRPVMLKVLMPGWTGYEEKYREFLLPVAGETLEVKFHASEYTDEYRRMKGDCMLGVYDGSEKMEYISDAYLMTAQEIIDKKVRVLFD